MKGISTGLIRANRLGVATTTHPAMDCVTAVISQVRVSRRYVRELGSRMYPSRHDTKTKVISKVKVSGKSVCIGIRGNRTGWDCFFVITPDPLYR